MDKIAKGRRYGKGQHPANLKDLTGRKFGKLTVVKRSDERSVHGAVWDLKCDCGNKSKAVTSDLTSGKIKTCGCSWSDAGKKVVRHNEESKIDGVFVPMLTKKSPPGASGVKGVRRRVRKNGTVRWQAHIGLKNKDIYLGSFETIEKAAQARKEAEEKYYKPYIEEHKNMKMKTVNLNIRIQEDMRDEFKRIAESNAQTPSALMRLWIENYIKENKKD